MEPETAQVGSVIISSVLTGLVSTLGTVKALNVHITYLKESLTRAEAAATRAHDRVDILSKRVDELDKKLSLLEQDNR